MRLSARVAHNTIIQVLGKFIATLLGLVAIALITRYLGRGGFGQYTTIITFLSFFGITADLGLTLVTVQMISQPGINQNKIISNLFSLRFVSALIFLGLAPLVVFFFPYDPLVKIGVAVTTLSFFFMALNQVLVGIFQKNLRMDKVSIAEISGRVILVISVIAAIRLNYGLLGIMAAMVISSAINFILHYLFSTKFVKIKFSFDKAIWKEIINKSWPLALTIVFNLIYLKTDTLILSLIKSQEEVGIYGAAYKVIDVLITIPFMFAGLILPIITASWAGRNKERFKSILQKSFDIMVMLAIPLAVGAQFTASSVMTLVAGENFNDSGPILKVLILAASIIFIGSMFTHGIIAIDKQKKIINAYIFAGITAVIGYLIFIPRYSYFGAAWVTIYSESVVVLASAYLVWRHTNFLPNLKIFFKSLAASIIMGASIYLAQTIYQLNLFIILTLATVAYFGALYILKGISRQDIMSLMNK
jgi:O-antigen/teichoic acid export membrane protein